VKINVPSRRRRVRAQNAPAEVVWRGREHALSQARRDFPSYRLAFELAQLGQPVRVVVRDADVAQRLSALA
jgi:hypothetical protein